LGYEATAHLNTREIPVSVPIGKSGDGHRDCVGHKIADKLALIPILRSGLGMAEGMLELLPQASVHHIGMYHLPGAAPVQYFNRLPRKCVADIGFVIDPLIASAGSFPLCLLASLLSCVFAPFVRLWYLSDNQIVVSSRSKETVMAVVAILKKVRRRM